MSKEVDEDAALRAAYQVCQRRTKEHDPAEYALIQLVPAVLRPACWALWAAANAVDDLADNRNATAAERAARVEAWIVALEEDLAEGTSTDPVRRALVDTTLRWHLDLSELHDALVLVQADAYGRQFPDWAAWRAWGRGNLLPWFDVVRDLFDRAGVPVALRLDRQEIYEQFLDGFRLTDILTDLSADLAQGDLLLPDEALNRFPGARDDLALRRWSPAVAALTTDLTRLAHHWVTQPVLTRGMHPGPATVLDTMAALLRAQLAAVTAAGPSLLAAAPRPSLATGARILAPARLRSTVAWRLTRLNIPRRPLCPSGALAEPRHAAVPASTRFQQPPGHPCGAQPPKIPADQMPAHVAVIMDGNGRWAEERSLPRYRGHPAGATAMREAVYGALEIGLRHLTLYAFSTENWKRDAHEVDAILALVHSELLDNPFQALDVSLRWHGRTSKLPADLVDLLRRRERATRTRTGLTLTLCINYGGRDEITRAATSLARAACEARIDPDLISEEDFARHLPHPDMPDVDLLWRTGGEQRTSNFLPWHASYAELHFTPDLWPDTDRHHLWQAIDAFSRRQRRHGAAPHPRTRPDPMLTDHPHDRGQPEAPSEADGSAGCAGERNDGTKRSPSAPGCQRPASRHLTS